MRPRLKISPRGTSSSGNTVIIAKETYKCSEIIMRGEQDLDTRYFNRVARKVILKNF